MKLPPKGIDRGAAFTLARTLMVLLDRSLLTTGTLSGYHIFIFFISD